MATRTRCEDIRRTLNGMLPVGADQFTAWAADILDHIFMFVPQYLDQVPLREILEQVARAWSTHRPSTGVGYGRAIDEGLIVSLGADPERLPVTDHDSDTEMLDSAFVIYLAYGKYRLPFIQVFAGHMEHAEYYAEGDRVYVVSVEPNPHQAGLKVTTFAIGAEAFERAVVKYRWEGQDGDNELTHGQRLVKITNLLSGRYDDDDPEATLTDVLTDLRHYAYANGLDFGAAVGRSMSHFQEEIGNGN